MPERCRTCGRPHAEGLPAKAGTCARRLLSDAAGQPLCLCSTLTWERCVAHQAIDDCQKNALDWPAECERLRNCCRDEAKLLEMHPDGWRETVARLRAAAEGRA